MEFCSMRNSVFEMVVLGFAFVVGLVLSVIHNPLSGLFVLMCGTMFLEYFPRHAASSKTETQSELQ